MSDAAVSEPKRLRRDAQRNRDSIVRAARETFARGGLAASVEEIAQRADVGVGTLYRHFPNKSTLIEAIFEKHINELADVARASLALDNPWVGLCSYLEHGVALQAEDRGFADILAVLMPHEEVLKRARARLMPLTCRLIERAQSSGDLRPDIVYEDIAVLFWTCGRVADSTHEVAPGFWRRYLGLMLDALRATSATRLEQPPLTPAQHHKAMEHLAERLRLGVRTACSSEL